MERDKERLVGSVHYLAEEKSIAGLVSHLFDSLQRLVSQEIALGKAEIKSEYTDLKNRLFYFLLYSSTAIFAAVLMTLSAVHLFSELGMADWAVYGVVGLIYCALCGIFYWKSNQISERLQNPLEGDNYAS